MTKKTTPPPAQADWSNWPTRGMCLVIFAVTLVAYLPALGAGFIWDDHPGHVTRPELQSLAGLGRIWFEVGATQQYYPFLHSAFWLEHRFWGENAFAYHLVNILLHATAACLVGVTLRRLAVRGAWLAALLFALHPVGVESVAWISEQKNTLSAVLYLCAALVYLRFDADRRKKNYALATFLFVLALATKTVTATLPAALLVVFWWQRGRLTRRDVGPLLPWFAFSAVAGWITAWVERTQIGAQGATFALDPVQRLLLAGRVVWFYLGKLLWPADLIFVYPRWTIDGTVAWQYLFPLGVVAVLVGLLLWRRPGRGPLAGALFFIGTLFPALGFVNVFPFQFSFVADHFQYLASLGILALVAAGLTVAADRWPAGARRAAALAVLAILGALTWRQSGQYRDVFTLWETTLQRNPGAWLAHHNLADALTGAGRPEEAIPHLETALKLRPDFAEAENNLGDDLRRLGRLTDAIPHLERALRLQPGYAEAHNNLGLVLAMSGRTADALPHFEQAIRLRASYPQAEINWAVALTIGNRFAEAAPHFERGLRLDPHSPEAHMFYGRALVTNGRHDEGIAQLRTALELNPDFAEAHRILAMALRQVGRNAEAQPHLEAAQRLGR